MFKLLSATYLHWSKEINSLIVWGIAFFMIELLPVFWKGCPWYTFTGTVRDAISWWHLLAIWLAVGFVVLFGHFADGWRVRYLIAWGLITAVGVIMHVLLP